MFKTKQYGAGGLAALLLCALTAGCTPRAPQPTPTASAAPPTQEASPTPEPDIQGSISLYNEFIGMGDEDLVGRKNEGAPQTVVRDGQTVVSSRQYDEEALGVPALGTYLLNEELKVTEVLLALQSGERQALLDNLSQELGQPEVLTPESGESYHARWVKNTLSYELIERDGGYTIRIKGPADKTPSVEN